MDAATKEARQLLQDAMIAAEQEGDVEGAEEYQSLIDQLDEKIDFELALAEDEERYRRGT